MYQKLIAGAYKEGTISIPYSRLRKIIHKGDIIDGSPGCRLDAWYVGYRVTHIDWWGVYAVPTDTMIEESKNLKIKKKHYKFKWQHITGVHFAE